MRNNVVEQEHKKGKKNQSPRDIQSQHPLKLLFVHMVREKLPSFHERVITRQSDTARCE